MLFFLFALLIGGAFGLLFRIWILLPASILIIASVCLFFDGFALAVLQQCVLAVLCLQGGYGMGLAARYLMIASRARALRPAMQERGAERTSRAA